MGLRLTFGILATGLLAILLSGRPPSALQAQPPASQQTPPPATQQPTQPFRTGANLVRVDVTVIDRTGNPVTNLTEQDFEVFEDDRPQAITSFKLVEANGDPTDELSLPIRSQEHAALEAARDDVRVFLIFWDEYHIGEFTATLRAREHLTRFVLDAFGPTDLVAFMDPLTTLDSVKFTRDRRALAEHVRTLRGRRGVYVPPRSALEEAQLERVSMRDIEQLRAQMTSGALRGAMLHMGAMREGRKSIILISETLGPLREDTHRIIRDLQQTANDTNTGIYVVDPRGLQVGRGGFGAPGPSDTLLSLAYASGAEPIVNNDMVGGMRRVVRQASAFYLLGYSPTNAAYDGKFHEIKVKVKRRGLEVRARAGYWAPRPEDMTRAVREAEAARLPDDISGAFSQLLPDRSPRQMDFWCGVVPRADGSSEVRVTWSRRRTRTGTAAPTGVSVEAKGEDGTAVFAGTVPEDGIAFDAPAGPLVVTISSNDAAGDVIDREVKKLNLPNAGEAALLLTTPIVTRARTPPEVRAALNDTVPVAAASRDFTRTDRLIVRVGLAGTAAADASVAATLVNRRGKVVAELPIQHGPGVSAYRIDLPMTSVGIGEYLIRIEAKKGSERAEALVPFRLR